MASRRSIGRFFALGYALALGVVQPAAARSSGAGQEAEPALGLAQLRWERGRYVAPDPSGRAVALTLDRELQVGVERLLGRARPAAGAVAVLDVVTGRVLALAERRGGRASLLEGRAVPAASLFKLVTTAALLERARLSPSYRVCTQGGQHGIARAHLSPPRGSAVCTTFAGALGHSRNAVYAQLVTEHLTREDLLQVALAMGFGASVQADFLAPFGSFTAPYNDLDFARAATGFEGSRLTPLGALQLAALIARGGRAPKMILVEPEVSGAPVPRAELGKPAVRAETARELARMMEVTTVSGTSAQVFTERATGRRYLGRLHVAGKTGTLGSSEADTTTSWFVGFAPSRRPRIAVSVLLENGGVWREKANEVARDVLRLYFARRGFRGVTDPTRAPGS